MYKVIQLICQYVKNLLLGLANIPVSVNSGYKKDKADYSSLKQLTDKDSAQCLF